RSSSPICGGMRSRRPDPLFPKRRPECFGPVPLNDHQCQSGYARRQPPDTAPSRSRTIWGDKQPIGWFCGWKVGSRLRIQPRQPLRPEDCQTGTDPALPVTRMAILRPEARMMIHMAHGVAGKPGRRSAAEAGFSLPELVVFIAVVGLLFT